MQFCGLNNALFGKGFFTLFFILVLNSLSGCGVVYKNKYFVPQAPNLGWNILGENAKIASTLCNGDEFNVYSVRINVKAIFIGPIIPVIPLPDSDEEQTLVDQELELFIYIDEEKDRDYLNEHSLYLLDDNDESIKIISFEWRHDKTLDKSKYTRYTYTFRLENHKTKIIKIVFRDPDDCELNEIVLKRASFKHFGFAPSP